MYYSKKETQSRCVVVWAIEITLHYYSSNLELGSLWA
jgi:hypothetical protein